MTDVTFTLSADAVRRGSAELSSCGRYRYRLWREWDPTTPRRACFTMLNPSTATATADDPTIRRCIAFAIDWGYGSLVVCNMFAWRSTDPSVLPTLVDPVGPENDRWIAETAAASALVVACWGATAARYPALRSRADQVLTVLRAQRDVHVIRLTKSGHPEHPLYLPGKLRPVLYAARIVNKEPA